MTQKKLFTHGRINVITLIVCVITLILMIYAVDKVRYAVGKIDIAVEKINDIATPVEKIEHGIGDAIKKGAKKILNVIP